MRMSIATRFIVLLALLGLAACTGGSVATPMPAQGVPAAVREESAAGPKPCKGQSTTSEYATGSARFGSRKSAFCIPAFDGFGGKLAYPGAHPAVSVIVTSSTKNYNHLIPKLGKGKPLFLLQIATSASTKFGTKVSASGGLESKKLVAGKSYDVYGQARLAGVAGIIVPFAACEATASQGKYGGEIANLGSRLAGANLTTTATIYLEVFPGRTSNSAC
jgi:hypothetical protein